MTSARTALLGSFRWQGGHAHVWRVFADADALAAVVTGLVEPWRGRGVTRVVRIESRGFLLGATFLGISLLVDQLGPVDRTAMGEVTALVTADELGPSGS